MTAKEKKAFAEKMRLARMKKARERLTPKQKKATKTAPKKGKGKAKRRNPNDEAEEAAKMYEKFHGRAPERVIEHTEQVEYRSDLAELGKLIELRVKVEGHRGVVPIVGFGPCQVTCTPDGRNIYFVGGKQTLDLSDFGLTGNKDHEQIGEVTYIKYLARKGFHNFEPIEYYHEFGEENGIRPTLAYDTVNRALFLLGGDYTCLPAGITN